jgi:Tol biopolymer transport system component/DNA-binding winged helix-turn-helix (wHTH) protein
VFDDFEIDSVNRTLLRGGLEVALTSKVFDILWVFVENPNRLLEKSELLEKVWQGSFVEEGNLARNISTLRKALGDNGKEHKYIATVQGHGYRFIADIAINTRDAGSTEGLIRKTDAIIKTNGSKTIRSDDRSQAAPKIDQAKPVRTHLYRRPFLVTIAGICLIASVVIAFRLAGAKPRDVDMVSYERIRRTRLTQQGNVGGGTISPDGQYLAYGRISGNEKTLALRQMATGSVIDLQPQGENAYWAAAFAPDNSFLYYIEREAGSEFGSLYRIPLLGGQPHKLVEYADGGLTVSPDGRKLGFTRIDRQKGTSSIIVVDNDGADERAISSTELDSMFYSLDWAPDGKSLVYSFKRHEPNHEFWYLAEVPAAGGAEQRIGDPSDSTILMAKWLPDKTGLIVNAIDEVTRQPQIYSVSYLDGAKRRITNDLNSYVGFSMTTDGRSIVLPAIYSNRQIWNLPGGQTNSAIQISTGVEKHFDSVAWSGEKYLVFDEDENSSFDSFNIYRSRPDGSAVEQLTFGTGNNMDPAVSPDGLTVAFVSSRSGTSQLWRMNIDGHDMIQITELPNNVIRPVFSPDGQTVFFSMMVGGKCNIWQVPVNGGEATIVVDDDVYRWAVSPKGDSLTYSFYDKQEKLVRTRIHSLGGDAPDLLFDISPETWMEWSNDGKALYFDTAKDGSQNVWRQPIDGSKPQPVTSFNSEQIFRFAWSPDGKNLACIRHTTTYDTLVLRSD